MRLRAIRLWNVRRFAGRGVSIEGIGDGVNVLSAANEQGKSTCFDALHALFFQPSSGTPKAVRLLRPYSGGSVRIEADVETGGGLFRITKQFYAGRQTTVTDLKTSRLIAQADLAEAWISALVRGGTSGPAGLLWVRQGVTEMGVGTRSEAEEELRAREDVLTSVAGEVEALTGGRRMARILDCCINDLDSLVTSSGAARTGGLYNAAIGERDELVAAEARLALDLQTLRDALTARRQKRARLNELQDPVEAESRLKDKKDAESALEDAKLHALKLAASEAQATLAKKHHETEVEALADYDGALAKAVKLGEKMLQSEGIRDAAKLALKKAQQADEASLGTLEIAEAKDKAARQELARANKAREAARADERITDLEARLALAASETQKAGSANAESAALAIPEKSLAKLEELERQIATLRATEEAAAATLQIDYAKAASGKVLRAGVPLVDGESVVATETIELEIETVGSMTVTPGEGSGETVRAKRRAAEEANAALLDKFGAETSVEARARARLSETKANAALIAQAAVAAAAPEGIETLRVSLQRLKELTQALDPTAPSVMEAEAVATDGAEKLVLARAAREKSRAHLETAKEAHLRAEANWIAVRAALDEVEQGLGPTEARESERLGRAQAVSSTQQNLAKADEAAGALRIDAPDVESMQAKANRAASRVERARQEVEALGRDLAGLDATIGAKAGDAVEEEYEEVRGRLESAEKRVGHFKAEVAALTRLKRALEDSRSAAKELYFGPVLSELKPLLALLLEEASITFDETTLLPLSLERAGQDEAIDVLSGGMREQLSVLTRLAFARLLARDGRPVPVILDDALVFSDDDRIERMFNALHRQASDLQIIVFTCRQRAFERLGGDPLQMVEWQPDVQ